MPPLHGVSALKHASLWKARKRKTLLIARRPTLRALARGTLLPPPHVSPTTANSLRQRIPPEEIQSLDVDQRKTLHGLLSIQQERFLSARDLCYTLRAQNFTPRA
eukprot:5487858-Pleurochrysis_carterae.AAC.3